MGAFIIKQTSSTGVWTRVVSDSTICSAWLYGDGFRDTTIRDRNKTSDTAVVPEISEGGVFFEQIDLADMEIEGNAAKLFAFCNTRSES